MLHVLARELAEGLAFQAQVHVGKGSARYVHYRPSQGLVEGGVGVAESSDAASLPKGVRECAAEGDGAIFGGVMIVHLQIAGALHGEFEPAVSGQGGQQVVEEADARVDLGPVAAERHPSRGGRLRGSSFEVSGAICHGNHSRSG